MEEELELPRTVVTPSDICQKMSSEFRNKFEVRNPSENTDIYFLGLHGIRNRVMIAQPASLLRNTLMFSTLGDTLFILNECCLS